MKTVTEKWRKIAEEKGDCHLVPLYIGMWRMSELGKIIHGIMHKKGWFYFDSIMPMSDGNVAYCFKDSQYDAIADSFAEHLMSNSKSAKIISAKHLELGRKSFAFGNGILVRNDLAMTSNKQLARLYVDYVKIIGDVWLWGTSVSILEYKKPLLSSAFENYILQTRNSPSIKKDINMLIAPIRETFMRKERRDLFKLTLEAKSDKKLKKIFEELNKQLLVDKLRTEAGSFYRKIVRHKEKYCWLSFYYSGPALDAGHYITEIKELLPLNIKEKISEIDKEFKVIRKTQSQMERVYKISTHYKNLLKIIREFTFLKAYRKEVQYHSFYALEKIQEEISKRLGIGMLDLRYLTIPEATACLSESSPVNRTLIRKRRAFSVLLTRNGTCEILLGKRAREEFQRIAKDEIAYSDKLTGQIANPGKARGLVKIVNNFAEMSKIQEGDILVSIATNPGLIPAMKKAAAFVTDIGGITCHAAIVSRELKKPCIIGTKNATRILKDGDLVEVDANKGVIKIIR